MSYMDSSESEEEEPTILKQEEPKPISNNTLPRYYQRLLKATEQNGPVIEVVVRDCPKEVNEDIL